LCSGRKRFHREKTGGNQNSIFFKGSSGRGKGYGEKTCDKGIRRQEKKQDLRATWVEMAGGEWGTTGEEKEKKQKLGRKNTHFEM